MLKLSNLFSVELILVVFLIFLLIFIFKNLNKTEKSFSNRFMKKLSMLSSLFIPIGIYLTYKVFHLQFQSMKREATYKVIDRGWLNVNKSFVEYYNECPEFIDSLYFKWQKKIMGIQNDNSSGDKWYAVNYISITIFQAWEDFITSSDIDDTGTVVWINNFLQWANSPLLYNNWNVLKTNFSDTTQHFGNYLFYMAKTNKINNEKDLHNVAVNISNNDILKNIFEERFA